MKKNMIVGIAMAMGILSVGVVSASAAGSCCKSADKQAVQQFTQETDALTATLKAKKLELRGLYGFEGLDTYEVNRLEAEIKGLKDKINVSAGKHDIPSCSRS